MKHLILPSGDEAAWSQASFTVAGAVYTFGTAIRLRFEKKRRCCWTYFSRIQIWNFDSWSHFLLLFWLFTVLNMAMDGASKANEINENENCYYCCRSRSKKAQQRCCHGMLKVRGRNFIPGGHFSLVWAGHGEAGLSSASSSGHSTSSGPQLAVPYPAQQQSNVLATR